MEGTAHGESHWLVYYAIVKCGLGGPDTMARTGLQPGNPLARKGELGLVFMKILRIR